MRYDLWRRTMRDVYIVHGYGSRRAWRRMCLIIHAHTL
jgi:hypothetical protein